MPNPVVHFEIVSPEAKALRKFYAQAFGWTIDADNPFDYGIVDTDSAGMGIGGGIGSPMEGGAGHLTFYVEVPDIDATLAKIVAIGGTVLMPKMTVPGTGPTLAHFADPAGHRIGLIEAHSMGGG